MELCTLASVETRSSMFRYPIVFNAHGDGRRYGMQPQVIKQSRSNCDDASPVNLNVDELEVEVAGWTSPFLQLHAHDSARVTRLHLGKVRFIYSKVDILKERAEIDSPDRTELHVKRSPGQRVDGLRQVRRCR